MASLGTLSPSATIAIFDGLPSRSTRAQPSVALTNRAPGAYSITLRADDGRIAVKTYVLEPGDDLVAEPLTLQPGGSVNVIFEGPANIAHVELIQNGRPVDITALPSGSSEILRCLPGPTEVRLNRLLELATEEEFEKTYDVMVKAGETVDVKVSSEHD